MKIVTTALAVVLLLAACVHNSKQKDLESLKSSVDEMKKAPLADYKVEEQYNANAADTTVSPQPGDNKKQPGSKPIPNPDWDKKIIKTAALDFEVKDFKGYNSKLREKIKGLGGYIAQEEQNQTDYKIENIVSIKVPVDQFDNALVLLTNDAEKLNEKKVTSQDVTGEYVDTKSRIEAKKQVRQRYIDLLKQAKNMEEILNVQSEINDVQEQIESAAGRVEYLGHSSAFSTINLTYYQVLNPSAKDNNSPNFGTKVGDAFKTGWGWIVDLFVGLVTIWPLALLTFIVIIIFKRMRIQKPKQA
jgi:Domain of unknown function (DUF4349)